MDYPLENLGPERFQQLCQALLVQEHPNMLCFPVAQPDGGRDAVSFIGEGHAGKFMVFQVKFSRRALADPDPHKWLLAIMESEAPKARELVSRGASQYFLLTNVSGTGHLETGAIDRLNKLLSEQLGIPSSCWWRDDINRRLDSAWSLKWLYPELMTGPDFLRAIIESGVSEHRERRAATLNAFLRHQYELDEEVRFKQVELHNKLLDLFVDVPVAFRDREADPWQLQLVYSISRRAARQPSEPGADDSPSDAFGYEVGGRWMTGHEEPVGATTLLLDRRVQFDMPHVVLEGAPGQGKSTIAQYICQVHRMKLLREEALALIAAEHREAPARLPIKVDLRDFATWLSKKNPFEPAEPEATPSGWQRSLESFLAALISFQSGGAQFTADDLISVVRVSSVLIVLDGLDEVADIMRRNEVVEEILKGVQRLEANAAALQTIVTSRPAAFANSPGMPQDKYTYLQLLSLTRKIIDEYAERWLRARRVDSKQSTEFKKVLRQKLSQPHLRDLARNPMQLTILLSLVLTRGASLPDKRTALYDSYIDLFLSRESEKSPVVREHRDLLVDIHRYLAWILHSEAEQENPGASISQERLQQLVTSYLSREGHDSSLAAELFTGMVERVVALVSRVQGTFEFEVQPLREYFAARFLYDTAPYSPPGKERRGTKPDRFDAISRNFYWLNVTRFYAGCFSKGELPALVERLGELAGESGFRATNYPRTLGAMLLADWVFTQNPKSVQQVVGLVLEEPGLRYVLASGLHGRRRGGQAQIVLPPKCGKDQLISGCFEILSRNPPVDYALAIADLLRLNGRPEELTKEWAKWLTQALGPKQADHWLEYGLHMGALSTVDIDTLKTLVGGSKGQSEASELLFRARRLDYLEESEGAFEAAAEAVLEGRIQAQAQRRVESALDALAHALDPSRYALAFQHRGPVPLTELAAQRGRPPSLSWSPQLATNTESFASHAGSVALAAVVEEESKRTAAEWATEIGPWDCVVEAGRGQWGDKWALLCLANVAAGIKSSAERCKDHPDLLDHARSLCRRARHARLQSGSERWWASQFRAANSPLDRLCVSLLALSWAGIDTLVRLAPELDSTLAALSPRQWHQLALAVRQATSLVHLRALVPKGHSAGDEAPLGAGSLPTKLSARAACALALRARPALASELYTRYVRGPSQEDAVALDLALTHALDVERLGSREWQPNLQLIRTCYELGGALEPSLFQQFRRLGARETIPASIALEIANQPARYPLYLLNLAEERCRQDVARRVKSVANVAEKEHWFGPETNASLFEVQ